MRRKVSFSKRWADGGGAEGAARREVGTAARKAPRGSAVGGFGTAFRSAAGSAARTAVVIPVVMCLVLGFGLQPVVFIPDAASSSLWSEEGAGLYADHTASDEGDIVTIIIEESAEASEEARTDSGKAASTGLSIGSLLSSLKDLFSLQSESELSDIELSGEDSFEASGSTSRRGDLQAMISARVEEVLPSGNLKIEGEKSLLINNEEQKITISGVVRPADIHTDNTVYPSRVADVRISYDGEGVISDKQEPGLLTRLFNWLF